MLEAAIVFIIVLLAVVLTAVVGWTPNAILWLATVLLAGINLAMTVINLVQAHRRNPRFLDGWILGSIQLVLGGALLGLFLQTIGPRTETWIIALPFLIGGMIVLVVRGIPRK